MTHLIDSVLEVERSLSKEKGPFCLFALFLREEANDRWDLIVSAPWTEKDEEAALKLVAAKVQEFLSPQNVLAISRIVLVEPSSPSVAAINRTFPVKHSPVEVRDNTFFGMSIRHAHIFASRGAAAPSKGSPNKSVQRTRRNPARR